MDTIRNIITTIKNRLASLYSVNETDSLIQIISQHVFHYRRIDILMNELSIVPYDKLMEINRIVDELLVLRPLQYIINKADFYGLEFYVDKNVLIPRQETEELVDWIIKENSNSHYKILDIGTGSGCIAIALANNLKKTEVFALDVSAPALEVASRNAGAHGVNITFLREDILNPSRLFNNLPKFDIIVSNPPYIILSDKDLLPANVVKYEPETALFVPNENYLLFYKAISEFALIKLNQGGKLYFEINEYFGEKMVDLMKKYNFVDIVLKKDLNGKDRMIRAVKNF